MSSRFIPTVERESIDLVLVMFLYHVNPYSFAPSSSSVIVMLLVSAMA